MTSQTKVAHESIKSSNRIVAWGIAQLDTLMKMPNKMLHPRTVGITRVFSLTPMQKGSSVTVLQVSLRWVSVQKWFILRDFQSYILDLQEMPPYLNLQFLWIFYCKLVMAHVLTKWRYQKFGRCLGKDALHFVEFCSYLNPFLSSVAWSNAHQCSWKTPVELDEFCRCSSVIWQVSSIHARKNGNC